MILKILKTIWKCLVWLIKWQPKVLIKLEIGAIEKLLTHEIIKMLEEKSSDISPKTKELLWLEIIKRIRAKTGI